MLHCRSSCSEKKNDRSFSAHLRGSTVLSNIAPIFLTSLLGVTNFLIISSDNNWLELASELAKSGEVEEVLPDSTSVVSD